MRTYVGIDNGLDGGVVIVREFEIVEAAPMPVTKLGKGRVVNCGDLLKILIGVDGDLTVLVESPSKHSAGVLALCSTWQSYGRIMATLELGSFRHQSVDSKKWQKAFWTRPKMAQGTKFDTKAAALLAARRIWPDQDWKASDRCKVPHSGIVDAALIAEFGRRMSL